MKRQILQQYSGIKLTKQEFKELESIGTESSFAGAFTKALDFLEALQENRDNYHAALGFLSEQLGIESDQLEEIVGDPHIKGAAVIVNQALISIPATLKDNPSGFRNKAGAQLKLGKAFATMVMTMQDSDIDFETIDNGINMKPGILPRNTQAAYENVQTALIQAVQEAIMDANLVQRKSEGIVRKSYYASMKDDSAALTRAAKSLEMSLEGMEHCVGYEDELIDIPRKSDEKSHAERYGAGEKEIGIAK